MSSLQIFSNPSIIPPDLIQHHPSIICRRTLLESQPLVFPTTQQVCRLRFDQQPVDLSHLWEHWVWEVR